MQAVDGATLELDAGFEEACLAVERELRRLEVAPVHQETYALADGTRARTWLGVVDASLLSRLWYGVFVRVHATAAGTQVVLYVLGDAELEFFDKDSNDVVTQFKAGLGSGLAR